MNKNTVNIIKEEFDKLPEYSLSNPTGQIIGKRWKRRVGNRWYLCEYIPDNEPDYIGIAKKEIHLKRRRS